jgi:hypothetical protein
LPRRRIAVHDCRSVRSSPPRVCCPYQKPANSAFLTRTGISRLGTPCLTAVRGCRTGKGNRPQSRWKSPDTPCPTTPLRYPGSPPSRERGGFPYPVAPPKSTLEPGSFRGSCTAEESEHRQRLLDEPMGGERPDRHRSHRKDVRNVCTVDRYRRNRPERPRVAVAILQQRRVSGCHMVEGGRRLCHGAAPDAGYRPPRSLAGPPWGGEGHPGIAPRGPTHAGYSGRRLRRLSAFAGCAHA